MVKDRGFTLIEVLLALSILSLVCLTFLNVMTQSYKIWMKEDNCLAKTQKGELAVQTIINQLRCARDININSDQDEIEFRCYYQHDKMKWLKYGIYLSDGVPALGFKKADYGDGNKNYPNYMPLINNVTDLKFIDVNGNSQVYKIKLIVSDNNNDSKTFTQLCSPHH